jgi:hypothetical protein
MISLTRIIGAATFFFACSTMRPARRGNRDALPVTYTSRHGLLAHAWASYAWACLYTTTPQSADSFFSFSTLLTSRTSRASWRGWR